MANTNAPFGFKYDGVAGGGAAPTVSMITRPILYTDTTKIFHGDPVINAASANSNSALGYICQWAATPTTGNIAGIFNGCRYLSLSQGKVVYSPFWPGGDAASGSVYAEIIPFFPGVPLQFYVQAASGPITAAQVGQNAEISIGTGSTVTGISGASLTGVATTSTLPWRITGLYAGVGPGSDTGSAYNWVYVAPNLPGNTTPS